MINIGLMPFVVDSGSEALRQANLAVDATEQERTKVGGQGAALKIGTEGLSGDGRKTQLVVFQICTSPLQSVNPNSYRLTNNPMTMSCI